MSKYGIFVLGAITAVAITALAVRKGGKKMNTFNIILERDDKVNVWGATSEDVPGLVLESESLDAVIEQARRVVPQLLRLNKVAFDINSLSLNFIMPDSLKPVRDSLELVGA